MLLTTNKWSELRDILNLIFNGAAPTHESAEACRIMAGKALDIMDEVDGLNRVVPEFNEMGL